MQYNNTRITAKTSNWKVLKFYKASSLSPDLTRWGKEITQRRLNLFSSTEAVQRHALFCVWLFHVFFVLFFVFVLCSFQAAGLELENIKENLRCTRTYIETSKWDFGSLSFRKLSIKGGGAVACTFPFRLVFNWFFRKGGQWLNFILKRGGTFPFCI